MSEKDLQKRIASLEKAFPGSKWEGTPRTYTPRTYSWDIKFKGKVPGGPEIQIKDVLPGYQASTEASRCSKEPLWGPVKHDLVSAVRGLLIRLNKIGGFAEAWGHSESKRDTDAFIGLVRSGFFSNLALCAIILEPDLDPVVAEYLHEILQERIGPHYRHKALGPMEILGRHATNDKLREGVDEAFGD